MEDRGTLWTLLGLLWDLMELSRTLQKRIEPYLTFLNFENVSFLDLPKHFWCFLFGKTSRIFLVRCVNFDAYFRPLENLLELWRAISYFGGSVGLMVSAERSGALSAEPCDVCQNCVQPSWTLWNMVDPFFETLSRSESIFDIVLVAL